MTMKRHPECDEPKPDYLCVPSKPWTAHVYDADAMQFRDAHGRDICTIRCRGRCVEVVVPHVLACVNAAETKPETR